MKDRNMRKPSLTTKIEKFGQSRGKLWVQYSFIK